MENDPNSFNKEIENVDNANSQELENGTDGGSDQNTTFQDVTPAIDYKTKFSESAKEAQRLYAENQRLLAERQNNVQQPQEVEQHVDNLYPGFEDLDEEAQKNLISYSNQITKRAKEEIYNDPAIAFAKSNYNEKIWNDAFTNISLKYPELAENRNDFKNKYYNVNNVPQNIENILDDVAKIYLFDQAKAIGAKEETAKLNRIETERATSGDKTPQTNRSLEDWTRMAQDNPAQFAKFSKEYNNDLESGKI